MKCRHPFLPSLPSSTCLPSSPPSPPLCFVSAGSFLFPPPPFFLTSPLFIPYSFGSSSLPSPSSVSFPALPPSSPNPSHRSRTIFLSFFLCHLSLCSSSSIQPSGPPPPPLILPFMSSVPPSFPPSYNSPLPPAQSLPLYLPLNAHRSFVSFPSPSSALSFPPSLSFSYLLLH